MPFGMPRLNSNFRNSVFFLYGKNPRTGELEEPCGSGFFVGMSPEGFDPLQKFIRHVYAITCKHTAADGASVIRLNTTDGESRFIDIEPHEWQFIEDGDDIAAYDVTDRISKTKDEFSCVPLTLFVTKEFITQDQVDVGEDGFMLGLFADQAGKRRNMVAARFGNVSLLAHDDEPLKQPNGNYRPSHLFDMRSRAGFSGSPVFVYRTPASDLRTATERGSDKRFRHILSGFSNLGGSALVPYGIHVIGDNFADFYEAMEIRENTFLALFGIHVGQYHDRVRVKKSKSPRAESTVTIVDGDELDIPNSMALVAPAWAIEGLLSLEHFTEQRRLRELADREYEKNVAKPESAGDVE